MAHCAFAKMMFVCFSVQCFLFLIVFLLSIFLTSELNGLSKELNIQLMADGQPQESKEITGCLFCVLVIMTESCFVASCDCHMFWYNQT